MSSPKHPRQRAVREDHLRNHERLLEAALELFDQRGIEVALREVAEHAGVGQASMFRHFANRDQLIIELYDRASTDLSQRLINTLTTTRDQPQEDRLDALFTTVVDTVTEHPSYGRLAAKGAELNPDRATDPTLTRELAQLIADSQQSGLLAPDVTGFDLVITPMLVGGMLTHSPNAALMVPRIMTILRRGLAPESSAQRVRP